MLDDARLALRRLGLPGGDLTELPDSDGRFPDGGQYKWEVAGAVSAGNADALFRGAAGVGVHLNQVTHTEGIMRLTDGEIRDLVSVTSDADRQLMMAVGPRGVWDIGGQRLAPSAVATVSAYRLRGTEQLVRAVEDVRRALGLGVRGFLVYDEGLLYALSGLRSAGEIPAEVRLKASSNMGVANPAHCRVVRDLGADSINLQRDLDLGMIAAARAAVDIPFDLHTDNPPATGGFVRTYEVPEMIRVGAPLYLKTGNAAQRTFDAPLGPPEIAGMVHQMAVEAEMIARHAPQLQPSLVREH